MSQTFVADGGKRIVVAYRADLAQLIPHAKELEYQQQKWLVFLNGHEEAKLCRNLGVIVPSPIISNYSWETGDNRAPWDIQRITAALLVESPRAYVLSTMGTGKTRATLFAADYLLQSGKARRVLIAAPLSTLTPVWEREIFYAFPKRRAVVLHGSREKRFKALKEDAEFFITNHHGLWVMGDALVQRGFQVVVFDEVAVLRNKSTDLWKAAHHLLDKGKPRFAWGLTGSPTPNAPTDAWAQLKLLTPERAPRTMAQFQDATMRRITQFKWVPRPEANEMVLSVMQPSVRFTRDDVMELPETTYVDRAVALDADAAKAYKLLFDKMRMQTAAGEGITAVNEGVLQSKLLQVACGYIYTDKKTVYELPANGRRRALEEVIAETDRKIIVFVPYVHALNGIATHLRAKGLDVATIHGGTSRGIRDKVFQAFQDTPTPRVLVAHPQTMAHGLTLTAANTIIWYGPAPSLEIYEQANARITRPGQTSKTLIVHLSGTPVERATYARLRGKAKMQGMLLELFKNQELEF